MIVQCNGNEITWFIANLPSRTTMSIRLMVNFCLGQHGDGVNGDYRDEGGRGLQVGPIAVI